MGAARVVAVADGAVRVMDGADDDDANALGRWKSDDDLFAVADGVALAAAPADDDGAASDAGRWQSDEVAVALAEGIAAAAKDFGRLKKDAELAVSLARLDICSSRSRQA